MVYFFPSQVFLAESYGDDDEPIDTLTQQFVNGGVTPVLDGLRLKDVPTEADYQLYEEAGTDLAQAIGKKENLNKRSSMSSEVGKLRCTAPNKSY